MIRRGPVLASLILAVLALPAGAGAADYDLILRGGTIVDGSGRPPFVADLAIDAGRIAAIGRLPAGTAATEIDVRDLVVAPGFLNIHSHAQPDGVATALNMLSQGVTTEIINADGRHDGDLSAQLGDFARDGLALNIGGMVGFNSAWETVVGLDDVRPTPEQIVAMQDVLRAGLEAGAWGISGGLDYTPGYYATTEEVAAVLAPFAAWRVVFANHDRVTPESGFSSIAGMTETLAIGEASGVVPLITHMKVQGWEQGRADEILGRMAGAGDAGGGLVGGAPADVYPYLAGATGLHSLIIPAWAQAGGREAMLARFARPELRPKIREEADEAIERRFGGSDGVWLVNAGTGLTDLMKAFGGVSPAEAVMRQLEREEAISMIIATFGSEADLVAILQHPTVSIACDCGAVPGERAGHPRYWGSYPRVLGRYVREEGALGLAEAVHKMTGLPAKTLGMVDRGQLVPGTVADVTVFDAERIADRATYAEPSRASVGIVHTLVGGRFAWRDGEATGVQAGALLKRPVPEGVQR